MTYACSDSRVWPCVRLADKGEVEVDIQLWDASADAGKGTQLASGSTHLQWADWQQGAIHRQSIRLQGTGDYKVPSCSWGFHVKLC